MDLVSFESRNEFSAVRSKFEPELSDNSNFVVGAFANLDQAGKRYFYWIESGSKTFVDFEATENAMCLGIRKERNEPVTLEPISCEVQLKFICQEMEIEYAQ